MRRAVHAARLGKIRNIHKILVGKPKGTILLEDLDVDWEIILEWILKTRLGERGLDSSGSG
jgi:hypothetical protein